MGHYNSLNLQLQGQGKNIIELFSSVNAFKAKLKLFASQLKRQNVKYFPYLEKHIKLTGECNIEMFCSELENFNQEFERRFANLNNLQPIFEFISFPFGKFDNEDISSNLAHTFTVLVDFNDDETWIADSGASEHMSNQTEWFENYCEFDKPTEIKTGNGSVINAHGKGKISLIAFDGQDYIPTELNDVLY
ncbi:hypothetical protein ILUMI_09809, partial [Ignelater luminosus]